MTVKRLCENLGFKALALPCGEREVTGVYIGDLLSWVMGRACEGNAWITIMSNINIVAVASLSDVACIVVAEDVAVDGEVISVACEKKINILSSPMPIYETALKLSGQIQ